MGQEKQSRNDQSNQFVGQLVLLSAISYLNLQMTFDYALLLATEHIVTIFINESYLATLFCGDV